MPTYEYECESCGKHFTVTRSIDSRGKPACPKCSSRTVHQVLTPFYPKTIKKS